jgi:hypothetical protein
MSCNVDRGYKNVDIGYILIMQLSPFSNDYANNWPQENHFTSSTITYYHRSNYYYCPAH